MHPTHSLILHLCRFADPDADALSQLLADDPDYAAVLGQLLMHRMGGAAYKTLLDTGLITTPGREFRNTLLTIYTAGIAKSNALRGALETLAHTLKHADFPYALLKGAHLVSLYPAGLRTSNDIDILVSAQHIAPLSARLKAEGFTQGVLRNGVFTPATRADILSARFTRGETIPFVKETGDPAMPHLEVDVNFSLDFRETEADTVTPLLARAAPAIHTPAGDLYTLSSADFILHLCAHLYKEAAVSAWVNMGRDQALYKFADLYLLAHLGWDAVVTDAIIDRARAYGLELATAYAFTHTRSLFGLQNPAVDRLIAALAPADEAALRRIFDPAAGRWHTYDMDITQWVFCANRGRHLREEAAV